jgi:uncharacterized protein YecE (DUF72 family)
VATETGNGHTMWWIGTSGWQYDDWADGAFYPTGLARTRWLSHYSSRFPTVEVNSTFYRLPAAATFEKWAASVPGDFVVVPKISRYLSHVKRLQEPAEPVERFVSRARRLGPNLGPSLLQLPPNLAADHDLLRAVLDTWPSDLRLAFEPRHDSWFTEQILELLRTHDVALVLSDRNGAPQGPLVTTASWGYLRLHHGRETARPCYTSRQLTRWFERLEALDLLTRDLYVFFNNDPGACAPRDATRFTTEARRRGIMTATPS